MLMCYAPFRALGAIVALVIAVFALVATAVFSVPTAQAQDVIAESPDGWVPLQFIQPSATPGSGYGAEVASDGDLIATQGEGTFVLRPAVSSVATKLTDRRGYLAVADGRVLLGAYNDGVYLYTETPNGWVEELVVAGLAGPVAFHGDRLVAIGLGSGALWVYDRVTEGTWSGERIGAGYLSVAATPERIVVGKASATVQNPAGVLQIFEPTGDGGFGIRAILPSDSAANDTFGWSVAIDGDRIAVGTNQRGRAYVFGYREGRGWVENRLPVPPGAFGASGSAFGSDVAISGDRMFVGSPNGTNAETAGASSAVYTYRPNALGFWLLESTLPNPGGSPGFATSISATTESVVVGSPLAYGGSGRSFVFEPFGVEPTVAVAHAVSCLQGNGRVDTNIVNVGSDPAVYRVEFEGLSPRQREVAAGDWWRSPITGRRDANYNVTVTRDGVVVSDQTVSVDCDAALGAVVGDDEVQVVNACRDGLGYVLFQLVNSSSAEKPYIIEFAGVPNRSTSAQPFGASVRATTSRPNGRYGVTIRSGTAIVERLAVEVDC